MRKVVIAVGAFAAGFKIAAYVIAYANEEKHQEWRIENPDENVRLIDNQSGLTEQDVKNAFNMGKVEGFERGKLEANKKVDIMIDEVTERADASGFERGKLEGFRTAEKGFNGTREESLTKIREEGYLAGVGQGTNEALSRIDEAVRKASEIATKAVRDDLKKDVSFLTSSLKELYPDVVIQVPKQVKDVVT